MTILDKYSTGPEQGPFFNEDPIDTRLVSVEQYDTFLDLHDLETLRANINATLELFRDSMSIYTRPILLEQLDAELSDFAASAQEGDYLKVRFDKAITQRSAAHRTILEAMELPGEIDNSKAQIIIPTSEIRSVLPKLGDVKNNTIEPSVWLRVVTGRDITTQAFTLDGLVTLPTQGRWYRFMLQDTEFTALTKTDSQATR